MSTGRILATAFLSALAVFSLAHHGRRFLIVTEYAMPHPKDIYFIADYGALNFSGDWAQEASPGLLVALGDESRVRPRDPWPSRKEGAGKWEHEATGIELRHRLNVSEDWNFAVGLEAEMPQSGGPTSWSAQLIAGKELAGSALMFNLIAAKEEGLKGKTTWAYRAGWSPRFSGELGYSIEAQGHLESHGAHEVLLGIARPFGESSLFKLGAGVGLTKDSPDWTIRAGIVMKVK